MAAVEDLRVHTVADDFLKRGFGQRYQWVFAASISLLQAQGRAREAIETAERARARAFLDLLASRQRTARQPTGRDARRRQRRFRRNGRRSGAPALDRGRVLGQRHRDVRLGGEPRWPARVGAHRRDDRPISSRWCGTRPAPASVAPGLLVGAGRGARPWRALYQLLLGPVRQHLPHGAPAAGSPSCRTVRSSACRSPRCATGGSVSRSRPTTSTTSRRSGHCRPRRRRAARSTALLVGDPSPDASPRPRPGAAGAALGGTRGRGHRRRAD